MFYNFLRIFTNFYEFFNKSLQSCQIYFVKKLRKIPEINSKIGKNYLKLKSANKQIFKGFLLIFYKKKLAAALPDFFKNRQNEKIGFRSNW